MIGLDTNVLVRLLVQDNEVQTQMVFDLLAKQCSETEPGWVNTIVLVETVWVLEKVYRYNRQDICHAVEYLLQVKELHIEYPAKAWQALNIFRQSNVGYADILIGLLNQIQGCELTVTFDRKAAKLDSFQEV